MLLQGAVESVLERCSSVLTASGAVVPLDPPCRSCLASLLDTLTSRALRCLALASKMDLGPLEGYSGEAHRGHALLRDPAAYAHIESDMVFLGMVGLEVCLVVPQSLSWGPVRHIWLGWDPRGHAWLGWDPLGHTWLGCNPLGHTWLALPSWNSSSFALNGPGS